MWISSPSGHPRLSAQSLQGLPVLHGPPGKLYYLAFPGAYFELVECWFLVEELRAPQSLLDQEIQNLFPMVLQFCLLSTLELFTLCFSVQLLIFMGTKCERSHTVFHDPRVSLSCAWCHPLPVPSAPFPRAAWLAGSEELAWPPAGPGHERLGSVGRLPVWGSDAVRVDRPATLPLLLGFCYGRW